MEQLNKIEIRGYVGSITVHHMGERDMARFTVATSTAYKDKDGGAVIETCWHNVLAWSGKNIQELDKITKGGKVYVLGRLRNQKYTGMDGIERNTYDILASRLTLLDEGEPLQCEM